MEENQKLDSSKFEEKWKQKWLKDKLYKTPKTPLASESNSKNLKKKFYSLYSFPYPSGSGLHVGHVEGMVANDIVARYYRMKGRNVTLPMGWDSFGLPAENYAIKTGVPPEESTENAIKTFISQINNLGISVDWDMELGAHRPDYYRWTQWIFLQLYKNGLAYKKTAPVNWCPKDQTVLANEQVINGRCERCDTEVIQKDMEQWFFKITDFADRLDADLDKVDWPESTKAMQRNWIGKSTGAEIIWRVENSEIKENLKIHTFTTRFDTIPGPTFLVVAPEYSELEYLITTKNKDAVNKYIEEVKNKTDLERQASKEKTGIFTGSYAINPYNEEKVPIYVADYVLANYGTGAVMGMPGHDQRDYDFAKTFNLPIKYTLKPKDGELPSDGCYEGEGYEINSGEFDGLWWEDAREKIIDKLVTEGKAIRQVNYKLRDWLVSRQRYWGAPIPILYKDLSPEEQERQERYKGDPEVFFSFHAFGSDNKSKYHQWVHNELLSKGIKSINPLLPNANNPVLTQWITTAEDELKDISTDNLVVTGRSLGGWSALKLAESRKVRKLILVAPSTPIECDEPTAQVKENFMSDEQIWKSLEEFIKGEELNWHSINENVGEVVVFLSNDDPYIPLQSTQKYLENKLKNVRFIIKNNAGHFNDEHGYSTFQVLIDETLKPVRIDMMAVPESDLPLLLPTDVDFKPTGESPITRSESFKKQAEEKYGKGWHYEADTMDTFVDSSWYYFRFLDVDNQKDIFESYKANYWLPTDLYMIGAEHTVLHCLYSRFFTKFFFDQGLIDFDEPFYKMRHMGTILGPDGRKMSKRWGNVINPDDEIKKFGADAVRMYEMFMGPIDEAKPWNDKAESGVYRFLNKVWELRSKVKNTKENPQQLKELNKLIKKVSEDIENLSFNTSVAKFMEFVNFLTKENEISQKIWEEFLKLLAPFAPFITEELWSQLGNEYSVHLQNWPEFKKDLLNNDDVVKIAVQVKGKMRGIVEVPFNSSENEVKQKVESDERLKKYTAEGYNKVIFVQNKVISFV